MFLIMTNGAQFVDEEIQREYDFVMNVSCSELMEFSIRMVHGDLGGGDAFYDFYNNNEIHHITTLLSKKQQK